jgi:hypothetical protein
MGKCKSGTAHDLLIIPMKYNWIIGILFCALVSCKEKKEPKTTIPVTRPDSSFQHDAAMNPYSSVDISPMDMSYYPVDYPKLLMAKAINTPPLARVIYSRPHLQGRHIFHEVLRHGEPWRLGANEATELDLFTDAGIQEKKIPAGRYVLYCIPAEKNWTVVLNSNIDSWGLEPDSTKDIARFVVPVKQMPQSIEYFTMVFEKNGQGADLVMAWDNAEARLPINFQPD